MSSVTIQDNDGDTFTVCLAGEDCILTTVTSSASDVNEWIQDIYRIHNRRLRRLLVGLDVEWRPSFGRYQNPVAVLQLCVGRRCLVYQILYAENNQIPQPLLDFLNRPAFTFCGVGIEADIERLDEDYGITVGGALQDLRPLAAEAMRVPGLARAGIKTLAKEVMGLDIDKPKRVTLSRWDQACLTYDQIMYACVDAFLSFEIARRLVSLPLTPLRLRMNRLSMD